MIDDSAAFLRCSVAASGGHGDLRHLAMQFGVSLPNAVKRCLKILRNIHAQCLQRRNVQHGDAVNTCAGSPGFAPIGIPFGRPHCLGRHQLVDRRQERAQGLSRTGRRDNKRVLPRTDDRPCLILRFGGCTERIGEPCCDGLRKQIQTFVHMFDYGITFRYRRNRYAYNNAHGFTVGMSYSATPLNDGNRQALNALPHLRRNDSCMITMTARQASRNHGNNATLMFCASRPNSGGISMEPV